MKSYSLMLVTLLALSGAAFAAQPGAAPVTAAPAAKTLGVVGMSDETICPAPYTKSTSGYDVSKGESQCTKSAGTCADGYKSIRNDQNGQLKCVPNVALEAPKGWSASSGHGVYVFDSIPQPLVHCPKSTKDWQWGTTYFKESWNRMGCRANQKPAY